MKIVLASVVVAALIPAVGVAGPVAAQEPEFVWTHGALLHDVTAADGQRYDRPHLDSVLEVAANGDLLAAWTDAGGQALLRRSADAGRTWGPLVVAATADGQGETQAAVAGSASSVLVVTESGQDFFARTGRYTRLGDDGSIASRVGPVVVSGAINRVAATAGGYVALHDVDGALVAVVSHDDGRSFQAPVELGVLSDGWGSQDATYDVTAVGDDVTVAWADATGKPDTTDDTVMTRRSTDGGRTWLPAVPTDIVGSPRTLEVTAFASRRVVAAYTALPEQGPFHRGLHVADSADAGATWSPADLLGLDDPAGAGYQRVALAATDDGFVVSTNTEGDRQFYETVAGSEWQPTGVPGRNLPAVVADGALHVLEASTFSSYQEVPPLPPQGPAPLQAQPSAAGRDVEDACPAERVPAAGFQDVPASAAHSRSIDCVVWWQVARGRSQTHYAPAAPVTRAQMATFIAGAIEQSGDALPEPSQDWFSDDNGTTHERNINRLAEAGVLTGRGPGVYAPNASVSRGAMAKFLALSYEYTSDEELPDHVDYFADDHGHIQEPFINKVASVGLAAGVGSGYAPGGDVRRDQMATFIARWLDLVAERFYVSLPDET